MAITTKLLKQTAKGLYCPQGDFYIDGHRASEFNIVTHGHGDHAYFGHKHYLATPVTTVIMKHRLGAEINVTELSYGQTLKRNDVTISLHPAGHIPGAAQVRIEYKGEVAVVAGDFKRIDDGISTPFEVVPCNTFVTESTFALPIYRWPDQQEVFAEINNWWKINQAKGKTTVLFAYSLGKAQRVLKHLDTSLGPIFSHGAVFNMNEVLMAAGIELPLTERVEGPTKKDEYRSAFVIAPPSAYGTPWLKKFEPYSTGFTSGWMTVRGRKRSKVLDRGFVLSDHADWPDLINTAKDTGAEEVLVKHGYTDVLAKYLNEQGINAISMGNSWNDVGEEDALGEINNQESKIENSKLD